MGRVSRRLRVWRRSRVFAGAFLGSFFSRVEDPRDVLGRVAHPLAEVLLLVVCGTIADCDDYEAIAAWGTVARRLLRGYLPYHHGVPGGRWLTLLMNRINSALFSAAFTAWVREAWPDRPDFVAIDGKTSRRSHDRARPKEALHLVFRLRLDAPARARPASGRGQEQGTDGHSRCFWKRLAEKAGFEGRPRLHRRDRDQRQDRSDDHRRGRRLSAGGQSQPANPARQMARRFRRRRARRAPNVASTSTRATAASNNGPSASLKDVEWLNGDRRFPGEVPSAGEGLSRRGGLPAKRSRRTPHLLPLQDIGRAKGRQNHQRDRTALPRSFAEGPAPWASSRTEPQWIASSPPSSHTKTKCRESQPFSLTHNS